MRLSRNEIQKILSTIKTELRDIPAQISLFGSRVYDHKRGGDIDLLIQVSSSDFKKAHELKSSLKFELEGALGDQRVDVTLATEEMLAQDPFLISIRDECQVLQ